MKKSFSLFKGAALSKPGFLPFLMTFLLFAAMQVDMKAQSSTTSGVPTSTPPARSMYNVPAGPFTTVPTAEARLLDAMKSLKATLAQQTEGTAPYNATLRTFNYYNSIYANLQAGKSVADSIVAGLEAINNSLQGGVTPEEAVAEKNAAINLLRP
jgi:hypothetical protein